MGRRTMIGAAVMATAALVIPVTLVLAGSGNAVFGGVATQSVRWAENPHQAPKDWKQVPEVGMLDDANDAVSVTVSAEMAKGKAKFRVISEAGVTPPGSITFSSKAANSFAFGYPDGCYFHPSNRLEWKRVGRHTATATTISALSLDSGNGCF